MIAWVGTATSILGSFAVALGYMQLGYSLFIVGSISWLWIGWTKRDWPLITLNGTFFLANIVGFSRAFSFW